MRHFLTKLSVHLCVVSTHRFTVTVVVILARIQMQVRDVNGKMVQLQNQTIITHSMLLHVVVQVSFTSSRSIEILYHFI